MANFQYLFTLLLNCRVRNRSLFKKASCTILDIIIVEAFFTKLFYLIVRLLFKNYRRVIHVSVFRTAQAVELNSIRAS